MFCTPADVLVGQHIERGLRVQRIVRVFGEEGQAQKTLPEFLFSTDLGSPGLLWLEVRIIDVLRVGGGRRTIQFRHRGHAHGAAGGGFEHGVIEPLIGQGRFGGEVFFSARSVTAVGGVAHAKSGQFEVQFQITNHQVVSNQGSPQQLQE